MAIAPVSTEPAAPNALAKLSGDYTLFLKLLTTQMQNQDPLDPMDTSQYTQQLVQYSQVEQSIQQSGTLKDILARLSGQDMMQASSLVGRTVRVEEATSGLAADAPARWSWSLNRPAASLVATITDAAGRTIDVRPMEPVARSFDWNGLLANGTRAPDGSYTLTLEAKDVAGNTIPANVGSIGRVDAVSMRDGALTLQVRGQSHDASLLRDVMLAGE